MLSVPSAIAEYPRFVTIEGIEGAGKSTAVSVIQQILEAVDQEVVLTREPGGTPLAERIRACMLGEAAEVVVPQTELLLMFAARVQHVHNVILPALQRGAWVISDRFTCSSYAYQGNGRGVDTDLIRMLEHSIVGVAPSLTLFLDVPPEIGLARARARGGNGDRIESERLEFFERAREGFTRRAMEYPERYEIINTREPFNRVQDSIRRAVLAWIERNLPWGPEPTSVLGRIVEGGL